MVSTFAWAWHCAHCSSTKLSPHWWASPQSLGELCQIWSLPDHSCYARDCWSVVPQMPETSWQRGFGKGRASSWKSLIKPLRYLPKDTSLGWCAWLFGDAQILWSERLGKAANFSTVQQCQRHFICYILLHVIDSDTDNFERFLVLLSGQNGHLRDCTLCSHRRDLMFPWLRTGHDQCHPQDPWFFSPVHVVVGRQPRSRRWFLSSSWTHTLRATSVWTGAPCMLLYVVAAWCHPCTEVQLFAAELAGQKPRVPTSCSSVFWVKFSETMRHMRHPIVKFIDIFGWIYV